MDSITGEVLLGNWCGYVGVSEDHPWFGKEYGDEQVDISCHGGLTYSDFCQPSDKEHGICHLVEPGEPDKVWWFGFDCYHSLDFSPGLDATIREIGDKSWQGDVYRDLAYVQRECTEIARQLKECALIAAQTTCLRAATKTPPD